MNLLAFDTTLDVGSVAFYINKKIVFSKSWQRSGSHSEMLATTIESGLIQTNFKLKDFDVIATTNGPGSFTGIRIAVNTAKTLAWSLNKKIFCVNSLIAIANSIDKKFSPLCVMLNAQQDKVFWAKFVSNNSRWEIQSEIQIDGIIDAITKNQESFFFTNLQTEKLPHVAEQSSSTAESLIKLFQISTIDQLADWTKVEALYIRKSAAEEKSREA